MMLLRQPTLLILSLSLWHSQYFALGLVPVRPIQTRFFHPGSVFEKDSSAHDLSRSNSRSGDDDESSLQLSDMLSPRSSSRKDKDRQAMDRANTVPSIPKGARISTTDADTLVIDLNAAGFGTDVVAGGAFTALWFSAIVPATVATTGLAASLFLVPFWLAGGLVAKDTLIEPFVNSKLEIGEYAWTYTRTCAGRTLKEVSGATSDLRGARIDVSPIREDEDRRPRYAVTLVSDKESTILVSSKTTTEDEVDCLVDLINDHLETLKKKPIDSTLSLDKY